MDTRSTPAAFEEILALSLDDIREFSEATVDSMSHAMGSDAQIEQFCHRHASPLGIVQKIAAHKRRRDMELACMEALQKMAQDFANGRPQNENEKAVGKCLFQACRDYAERETERQEIAA